MNFRKYLLGERQKIMIEGNFEQFLTKQPLLFDQAYHQKTDYFI